MAKDQLQLLDLNNAEQRFRKLISGDTPSDNILPPRIKNNPLPSAHSAVEPVLSKVEGAVAKSSAFISRP